MSTPKSLWYSTPEHHASRGRPCHRQPCCSVHTIEPDKLNRPLIPGSFRRREKEFPCHLWTPTTFLLNRHRRYRIASANAKPLCEDAPLGSPIRKDQAPPDAALGTLDDRLPSATVTRILVAAASTPRGASVADSAATPILLPHKPEDLAARRLNGQLGRFPGGATCTV